jgi:hypothetical protein
LEKEGNREGVWANMPFFLPDLDRGGGQDASVRRRAAASRGRRRPGAGGKGGGGRGLLIPVLTFGWDGARNRIGGGGQREAAVLGAAARWSLAKSCVSSWCGVGRRGDPGSIYRWPKAVRGGEIFLRRARAASRRRPVTRRLGSGGRSTRAGEG